MFTLIICKCFYKKMTKLFLLNSHKLCYPFWNDLNIMISANLKAADCMCRVPSLTSHTLLLDCFICVTADLKHLEKACYLLLGSIYMYNSLISDVPSYHSCVQYLVVVTYICSFSRTAMNFMRTSTVYLIHLGMFLWLSYMTKWV